MSDAPPPLRRLRSQKEREALFRAGFDAGLAYAREEAVVMRSLADQRAEVLRESYASFTHTAAAPPNRRHRKKAKALPVVSPGTDP